MTRIKKKYQGVVIPAVTPLTDKQALDEKAVGRMFDFFRRHKAMPFILGTTGEAASLPASVKQQYIQFAGRLKKAGDTLYAGISSNALPESIDMAKHCFDSGIDVVVATLPSYYALTGEQVQRYFEQLADSIPGPLMIYNIPATTHMSIPLETIDALSHHPNIVGTKDSERSEERLKTSLRLWAQRDDFSHFLGWAAQSANALVNGSDGLVPSTGNFTPALYHDLSAAAEAGDPSTVFQLQEVSDTLGNLYQSGRTLGESLAALKAIMNKTGLCETHMMPPLSALPAAEEAKLLQAMAAIDGMASRYLNNQ